MGKQWKQCQTLFFWTPKSHPEPFSHLPPHPIPQGHPSAPAVSTLSHALNLDWQSVSHMEDDAVKVLHSICQQIWKTQQWPQDWKRSVFIPIPKKGNAKKCSNYRTIALISHASKVMLKILQARLQQYVNHELPDVQACFRKGRGTRDQIANIRGSSKKQESSRKTSISALLTTPKPLTVWITINWKILKEMGIPDHLTCLLRNLYAGQESNS